MLMIQSRFLIIVTFIIGILFTEFSNSAAVYFPQMLGIKVKVFKAYQEGLY